MSKATSDSLDALHGALAKALADGIKKGDSEQKGYASLLNVARQFLKDNHIESIPTKDNPLGNLMQQLPEFDEEGSLNTH